MGPEGGGEAEDAGFEVKGSEWGFEAWVGSGVKADSNSPQEYQHQEIGAVAVLGLTCFLGFFVFLLGSSCKVARMRQSVLPNFHCCPRAVGVT